MTELDRPETQLDSFSFGGGVQSTAALVLAAQGEIDCDLFLFANVGNDSENPATLAYINNYSRPYAEAHGLRLIELVRRRRDGTPFPTLYQKLMEPESRSIPIPVRMKGGGFGRRQCTDRWKRLVINNYVTEHGATESAPWTVGIGFSTDEIERLNPNSGFDNERRSFPLIELGLKRDDCKAITADAGLPPAPKSSCFFCPFQTMSQWVEQRRTQPAEWAKSVALERTLNTRRERLDKDDITLAKYPLREVPDQPSLLEDELAATCDSGHCWT